MKPLHDKKHILAKRGLSLLCVLALCLGLLPVTALAAGEDAPDTLYVGNQQVIVADTVTYWTTDNSGGLTRDNDATDDSNDWTVRYDQNTATLTLRGATIKTTNTSGIYAVIYAQSNSQSAVSLTIELEGTNTIVCDSAYYGIYVNAEMSGTSYGKDASLTITGNGSLDVSGSSYGIYVKSGSGDASLTIENASVVANTTSQFYSGVVVQSSSFSQNSPALSLAVNGGSLTANGGDSGTGIQFDVASSQANNATTSLIVSNNAIVRAQNGIKASLVDEPTPSGTGIVFDDKEGTVYGNVELQKDLEIGEGETLTIPGGSSLTSNSNLTNNGTINVQDGGSVTGSLSGGTTITTPTISQQPQRTTVTKGSTAEFSITASAGEGEQLTYQWQQKATDTGSEWEDISNATTASYTISSTTTDMSGYQYRCVVTSASGVSVTSDAATLTVTQPVTGVTLDKGTLSLFTGNSATLTATVQPDSATNKNVTWSSNKPEVATVDANGIVTAKGAGTATITVTTEDGGKTATCTVTVTDKTYTISADTTALNFGSAYTGYAQPAAQTVTLTNTGNQQVTVTLPTANDFIITAGTGFTDGSAAIKPGETATFTVQPKAGLSAGTYSDTITVSDTNNNVTLSITASFTVKSRPSYNPPTVSEETIAAIKAADPGETVTVDLSSGSTTLDKEVFEALAGKDVTLVIDLGDGVSWMVKGSDVPEDADFTDIDMGVTMGSDGIPVEVVNAITGERGSVQITLAHDGAFGFTMTLTAPLGAENAGYWANLYYFNESTNKMTFETAAPIGSDGSVPLSLSHASQYAIVIDDHNHGVVTLPFTDVSDSDWFYDPVCYVYSQGLMTGTSATTFEPNTSLSRAMLVAVLHRLEGSSQASGSDFTDVAEGDWYAQAVNWAASVGVVNGFDDGTFQPNAAITREQMAAILRNYDAKLAQTGAAYKGLDVTAAGSLTHYSDAASVSDWAKDSVEWAVGSGLLGGYEDSTLRPQGTTTRAEVASVLQRYLEK